MSMEIQGSVKCAIYRTRKLVFLNAFVGGRKHEEAMRTRPRQSVSFLWMWAIRERAGSVWVSPMKGGCNPSMAQQEKRWLARVGSIGGYMRFVLPAEALVGLLVAHSKYIVVPAQVELQQSDP